MRRDNADSQSSEGSGNDALAAWTASHSPNGSGDSALVEWLVRSYEAGSVSHEQVGMLAVATRSFDPNDVLEQTKNGRKSSDSSWTDEAETRREVSDGVERARDAMTPMELTATVRDLVEQFEAFKREAALSPADRERPKSAGDLEDETAGSRAEYSSSPTLEAMGFRPSHPIFAGTERDPAVLEEKREYRKSHIAQMRAARSRVLTAELEAELWGYCKATMDAYRLATQRMIEPWGLLAAALTQAVAHIPPWWSFAPDMGNRGSLNMITVLVGDSGDGKGAATGSADSLVVYPTRFAPQRRAPRSGQAMMKLFMSPGDDPFDSSASGKPGTSKDAWHQSTFTAVMAYDEIKTLEAQIKLNETIVGYMCQAWSGEQLGGPTMNVAQSMMLEHGSYRLCAFIGAQPENTGIIFKHRVTGLPQRALILPAHTIPDDGKLDEQDMFENVVVEPLVLSEMPGLQLDGAGDLFEANLGVSMRMGRVTDICVPPAVSRSVKATLGVKRVRKDLVEPLDSHAGMRQVSSATGIGMLRDFDGVRDASGRRAVGFTDEDWQVAELIDLRSRACRDEIAEACEYATRREAVELGELDAVRSHSRDTEKAQLSKAQITAERRIRDNLASLAPGEMVSQNQLLRGLSRDAKKAGPGVVAAMVRSGQIVNDKSSVGVSTGGRPNKYGMFGRP